MRTDDRERRMRRDRAGENCRPARVIYRVAAMGKKPRWGWACSGLGRVARTCPRMRRGTYGRGGHVAGAWMLLPVGNGKRTAALQDSRMRWHGMAAAELGFWSHWIGTPGYP